MQNATIKRTRTETQDRVINMISWALKVPTQRINPYTHLQDDLHLDAVDLLLLIIQLENRFKVYFSPEEVAAIETVQDASFYIQKHAA